MEFIYQTWPCAPVSLSLSSTYSILCQHLVYLTYCWLHCKPFSCITLMCPSTGRCPSLWSPPPLIKAKLAEPHSSGACNQPRFSNASSCNWKSSLLVAVCEDSGPLCTHCWHRPTPIFCTNMHLDWTVAHSACTLKHNIINGWSGNNILPSHVILFLENWNVSHGSS